MGEFQDVMEGALFQHEWFKKVAQNKTPEFKNVVVAIYPATTSQKTSDDTGIIVAGETEEREYYVLEDKTGKYSPKEWAEKAISLYYKYDGNYIVAESNQGGDMITEVIGSCDHTVPVKLVHAKKGKLLRAEPVAYLYERGMVFHTNDLEQLEYELMTYDGDGKSPNRMDACVYALLQLSGGRNIVRPHVSGITEESKPLVEKLAESNDEQKRKERDERIRNAFIALENEDF